MKYWTLPFLMISLAQVACSGGSTGADDNPLLNDPSAAGTEVPGNAGVPLEVSSLMNNGGIGPEPNFWNCSLSQDDTSVALESTYQFFTDLSGVSVIGTGSNTFSWDISGADDGYIDLVNDTGDIPVERWFVSMRSPTTFSAAIAYRQSLDELANTSATTTNANIICVLSIEEGAVNADDEGLLNPLSDGTSDGTGGDLTSVAQSLINDDSEFGLERQLWQCIAIDDSLDLLLGFYPNGIGGTYSTRSGQLEGSQATYTVSEIDGVGTVTMNAVLNNQTDTLTFSSLVFEQTSRFDARLQSSVSNIDVLVTCNILQITELPL